LSAARSGDSVVTSGAASVLSCAGCGASPPDDEPFPFTCPNSALGDVDHVIVKILDAERVRFPFERASADGGERPFVRYRDLLHSYHRATRGGISDEQFVELVEELDAKVAGVEGHGFSPTPFRRNDQLSDTLGFTGSGGIWVKDETGNVAGSHKARHLMGVLLHIEVAELLGLTDPGQRPDLAIASCGNAALAAGVIAAAAARRLRVFVPPDADKVITERLVELGSDVVICEREPGGTGDPTYTRLRDELSRGALPFTCQGNLNGLAIEGGETLGFEMISELNTTGVELDHLIVQVGGGALASSCMQAFSEAIALGALSVQPRIHTVQTAGAHPLERAYHNVRQMLPSSPSADEIERALHFAAAHRSAYMWPWETEPTSVATGILDDETYDWHAVVGGMLRTGGQPIVVSEKRLVEAYELGAEAGFRADPTGSSGLAGLIELRSAGVVDPEHRVAVLFTGIRR